MSEPADPIAAVTHPDPYRYYAALAARAPLAWQEELQLWVAAGAVEIAAVLASPLCAVRPAGELVPRALAGTAAGAIFGRLVRMTEGPAHAPLRKAVQAALAQAAPQLAGPAATQAKRLCDELGPRDSPPGVTAFARRLPVQTLSALLGLPQPELPHLARLVDDYWSMLSPGTDAPRAAAGVAAAAALGARMEALCAAPPAGSLAEAMVAAGRAAALDQEVIAANALGLLTQSMDATAGLLGNALLLLGRDQSLREAAASDPGSLALLIAETARRDPPIHNTRRFVIGDGLVAGRAMKAGESILVLLAAMTFGSGAHGCPGSAHAAAIAEAGVRALLAAGVDTQSLLKSYSYKPMPNARVPIFAAPHGR